MITVHSFIRDSLKKIPYSPTIAKEEVISVICKVMEITKIELLISMNNILLPKQIQKMDMMVNRLAEGEPLAYVLGESYFFGNNFFISKGVLSPRPETEELTYKIIEKIKHKNWSDGTIFECGTGSGVIGLTLAKSLPSFYVQAWDISPISESVVKINKKRLNVRNFEFTLSDFLTLNASYFRSFFHPRILVSNPPYISQEEFQELDQHVKNYEPAIALTDGSDGLKFYRFFLRILSNFDLVMCEFGYNQAKELSTLFSSSGYECSIKMDLFGKERFLILEKTNSFLL